MRRCRRLRPSTTTSGSARGRDCGQPARATARSRGISLAETCIALAITSILLLATFVALQGTFINYTANQSLIDSYSGPSLLLHRVMTQVRSSTYLNVANSGLQIQVEVPNDNNQYIYTYSPANQQVQLSQMDLTTNVVTSLGAIGGVTSFQIPSTQWGLNPARLTLSLTVSVGQNSTTLSDSAVPRTTVQF